jgi:hypothetical protein
MEKRAVPGVVSRNTPDFNSHIVKLARYPSAARGAIARKIAPLACDNDGSMTMALEMPR